MEIEDEERTGGNKTKCIDSTLIGRTQMAKLKTGRTKRGIQTGLHVDECILKGGSADKERRGKKTDDSQTLRKKSVK
jgi:hypothetical protein